jgi:TetR/AcrR family transcriptional repressor of bet genes
MQVVDNLYNYGLMLISNQPTQPSKRDRSAGNEARRRQLIEATIESISVHGLNKTTLGTVTKIAKLSHGVVNFHFKSKDLLLLEAMRFLVDEHLDHWQTGLDQAGDSASDKLLAIIATDFDEKIANARRLSVWFAYWGEVNNRPAYREIAGNNDRQRRNEIKRLCRILTEQGEYQDIDAEIFSTNLEALIDGLWLSILMATSEMTSQKAKTNCRSFLSAVFFKHF